MPQLYRQGDLDKVDNFVHAHLGKFILVQLAHYQLARHLISLMWLAEGSICNVVMTAYKHFGNEKTLVGARDTAVTGVSGPQPQFWA